MRRRSAAPPRKWAVASPSTVGLVASIAFPFMDTAHLNWKRDYPSLYLNVFHPEYDNLFVVGLIQPDSGQWGLEDYQAQAVAAFIRAQRPRAAKRDASVRSSAVGRRATVAA